MENRFWKPENTPSAAFVQHVLLVAGIASLVYVLWQIRIAFLLVFAGILVAVLLLAAAGPVRRWTGLSRAWALALAGGAMIVVLAVTVWLVGSQVQSQVSDLANRLPQAVQAFENRFAGALQADSRGPLPAPEAGGRARRNEPQPGGGDAASQGNGLSLLSISKDVIGRLTSFGATALEVLANLVLVVIAGAFLAADPGLYRRGFVKLFPRSHHAEVDETLAQCGAALRQWLLAELIAMAIVALLVGLGTWAIGLPAPLALALFAGLMEFIPVVGPILGAIPALLLALTQGSSAILWTILLFVVVQQLESNVITPVLERRMVSIPPALLLFSVVAFGLLFGAFGVVVAAPLTVVAFVAVNKLYVQDTLHEQPVLPAEQ